MSNRSPRRQDGFTLLEVLVALAIALPTLLLVYRQSAVALALTMSSFSTQTALSRAQSRLDAAVDGALTPMDREGDDGDGYHWHVRIVALSHQPAPRNVPRGSPYAGGLALYAVSVQIGWRGGRGPEQVTLQTRRVGPDIAQTP